LSKLIDLLHKLIVALEVGVVFGLVLMAGALLVTFIYDLFQQFTNGVLVGPGEFNAIIGVVLEIFIVVELFRIAVAYMRHDNVIPTVLEAAFVAVARKFVVFEGGDQFLLKALGLAALLLSVAISWWLLQRSNACEYAESGARPADALP
jgi:uncharacterized membrane protein (DUF373 family)